MKKAMVAVVGAGVLLAAGCGSDDSAAEQSTTPAAPTVYRMGQDVESGGLVVNVQTVRAEPSIGDRTAPEAQRYVVLDAQVTNRTGAGLDLSCGTTIGTRMVDTQQRRFGTVPALDTVPGNPACGDLVPPGSVGHIGWVFEVPADADPAAFGFYDTTTQQPTEAKVVDLTAG